MRSEKQKAATEKFKALRNRKLKDMPFDERVRCKEWLDGLFDPDVNRACNVLRIPYEKKRIARKKALIAIMKMRGVEL